MGEPLEVGTRVLFNSNAEEEFLNRSGYICQSVKDGSGYLYFIYLDDEEESEPISARRNEFNVIPDTKESDDA